MYIFNFPIIHDTYRMASLFILVHLFPIPHSVFMILPILIFLSELLSLKYKFTMAR